MMSLLVWIAFLGLAVVLWYVIDDSMNNRQDKDDE